MNRSEYIKFWSIKENEERKRKERETFGANERMKTRTK